jgi:hypothetical protein
MVFTYILYLIDYVRKRDINEKNIEIYANLGNDTWNYYSCENFYY